MITNLETPYLTDIGVYAEISETISSIKFLN